MSMTGVDETKLILDLGPRLVQPVAQLAVWAAHTGNLKQGMTMSRFYGYEFKNEDEVFDVALYFRRIWQVDLPRKTRPNCFLCNGLLSRHEERICTCFDKVRAVRYYDPTPQGLAQCKLDFGDLWQTATIETSFCQVQGCKSPLFEVPAHVVSKALEKGHSWRVRTLCHTCYSKRHGSKRRPLRAEVAASPKNKLKLAELQQRVVAAAPTPPES